jgi:hypothetical protein
MTWAAASTPTLRLVRYLWSLQVSVHVHLTVVTLSIIGNLLTKSDADKLVLLLTRERPGYVITQTQMLVASRGHVSSNAYVLAWRDLLMCSNAFPKMDSWQRTSYHLSFVGVPSPCTPDADMFITSAARVLGQGFMLVTIQECSVEQYFGVVAFLNILPALYHLKWTAQHERLQRGLNGVLNIILVNICHTATVLDGQEQDDF